jgi:glycosyltransferase involved in cell wall biosynthesis
MVHTVSAFVAEEVRAHFRVDPAAVLTVHNGIDVPSGGPSPAQRSEPPYVLALGTVEPRKDLPGLVAAFDRVASSHPDLRLVVAGRDGWGVEGFDMAVANAVHRDRIDRLGWIDDDARSDLLTGASVLAYPSRYEGFGLPPLEAMAAGTPVVATTAGALPEVLGDAADLVPVGDVDALAAALITVLDSDSHRSELVARGHRRGALYDWTRCVDGLVELDKQALAP